MHRLKEAEGQCSRAYVCMCMQKNTKNQPSRITWHRLQCVRSSLGEVCVSEPTYLVTRHFCGKQTNNAPLLWAGDTACCGTWSLKHSLRGDVLCCSSKCTGESGNGGLDCTGRQAEQRQAAEDTWRKKSYLKKKKKSQTKNRCAVWTEKMLLFFPLGLKPTVLFSVVEPVYFGCEDKISVCRCVWISRPSSTQGCFSLEPCQSSSSSSS